MQLLDWTARQLKVGKRGATPKSAKASFDRLGITRSQWLSLVGDFGKLFSVVAGQPNRIDAHRPRQAGQVYRCSRAARELLNFA